MNGWFYGRTVDAWCWHKLATGTTSNRAPPLVQEPWRAKLDFLEEEFYFENPDGEETFGLPPVVPAGWRACWCHTSSMFWYTHEAIGRTSWELDVPMLQSQRLLSVDDLCCDDVRRSFRGAALRLHPGEGGGPAVWREALERFEAVIAKLAAMAVYGGSRSTPRWHTSSRCLAWSCASSGGVVFYECDLHGC